MHQYFAEVETFSTCTGIRLRVIFLAWGNLSIITQIQNSPHILSEHTVKGRSCNWIQKQHLVEWNYLFEVLVGSR